MFHVGQKVVCVNASNGDRESNFGRGYDLGLREGEIYTVLSAHAEFIEVDRVKGGCGWDVVRFRPLSARLVEYLREAANVRLALVLDKEPA